MRLRFLRKCTCTDTGYVKLQKTETVDKVQYLELTVNCRRCGKPWKDIIPKGSFNGKVLFTDAKPEKKKTPRPTGSKDPKIPKDPKVPKDPKIPKKDKKKKEESKVSLIAKKITGVVFDKDRD